MTYDPHRVLLMCREEDGRQAIVRKDARSVVGFSEYRAVDEKAHDLTWGPKWGDQRTMIQGRGTVLTQAEFVRTDSIRNLG